MAAVIRPVGIEQLEFGQRWIALLLPKIVAAAEQVVLIHGKAKLRNQSEERFFFHLAKPS